MFARHDGPHPACALIFFTLDQTILQGSIQLNAYVHTLPGHQLSQNPALVTSSAMRGDASDTFLIICSFLQTSDLLSTLDCSGGGLQDL